MFLLRIQEDLLRLAELDEISRPAALGGVDVEESGPVGDARRLLQIVRDDGNRIALRASLPRETASHVWPGFPVCPRLGISRDRILSTHTNPARESALDLRDLTVILRNANAFLTKLKAVPTLFKGNAVATTRSHFTFTIGGRETS